MKECLKIAIAIVAFEGVMSAAIVSKRVFYHSIMPWLMFAFVWGTFLFRNEYSFFSLLCILFLFARHDMGLVWRRLFLLTIAVFLAYDVSEVNVVL